MSPLGETLQRARLSKNVTFEDAERVTRIPRKYLEALELEDYGRLPAPVYARGFLRSYASFLGLDPAELLPFFPVGHVDEPKLDPLPELKDSRTYDMSGVIAMAVVGVLILVVIVLYTVGREDSSPTFSGEPDASAGSQNPDVIVPPATDIAPENLGPASALPDLVGQTLVDAISIVERTGATYIVVYVSEGDVPSEQVIDQSPPPDTEVGAGDAVTIIASR